MTPPKSLESNTNQNISYAIHCESTRNFKLEFKYVDLSKENSLNIIVDNSTHYNFIDFNDITELYDRINATTLEFAGKDVVVEYNAPNASEGMLLRYATFAIPKETYQKPLWIIGVAAGIIVIGFIIGFFIYRRHAKKQRKRKLELLGNFF